MKAMVKLFALGAATAGALVLSAGVGQGANLTSAIRSRTASSIIATPRGARWRPQGRRRTLQRDSKN